MSAICILTIYFLYSFFRLLFGGVLRDSNTPYFAGELIHKMNICSKHFIHSFYNSGGGGKPPGWGSGQAGKIATPQPFNILSAIAAIFPPGV